MPGGCSGAAKPESIASHLRSLDATTARGLEFLMGDYPILDRAPKGRDEADSPLWLRRHDEYAQSAT
jgi:predicted dithiol-disulfide oxidoreductase (DUF899 family)